MIKLQIFFYPNLQQSLLKLKKPRCMCAFWYDKSICDNQLQGFIIISRSGILRMFSAANLLRTAFSSTKALLHERLSAEAVRQNLDNFLLSYRFYNNLLIGKNYLATVAQYSKCYLCKFPLAKPFIRSMQGMATIDDHVRKINLTLLSQLPPQLSLLKRLGSALKYPGRNLFSALGLAMKEVPLSETQVKYLAAIEAVTLGFQLHNSVGGSFSPNAVVRIGLSILRKVIKDKYLVLAGDYLHIRGSVLASETGTIVLPQLLSEAEIALCKQVHLRDQLRYKIAKQGYEAVTIEQIDQISRLRAALTTFALKGICLLQGQKVNDQLLETVGLLVLYRQELEGFMFNFPRLFNSFVQIKTGNGLFWEECTLTQYLFFQSTQKCGFRLDLAYLNTVQLLSHQISILEERLSSSLTSQGYRELTNRIRYILMMYS